MSDISANLLDELAAARLKRSVRYSAVAIAAAQLVSQLISLVGLSILLRLLAPGDYGLVGMILPLVMFLRIFTTLGLNVATVQRPEILPEETSTLFWLNMLAGCAAALVAALLAPSLGWLYAKPAAATTLRNLGWALAGSSVVAVLGAQHQALLERELKLGRLGASRVTAQLLGALAAIAAAFAGWGVWSLVVQQYVELGLLSASAWLLEPWRPSWPRRGVEIASHLRLGSYFTAATIVFYLADNMDRVMVGRLVGPEAVGLYGQAYNVMIKPVYVVVTPLVALILSSLSRAVHQPETRRQLVVAYYRLLAIILMPAAVGLVIVGPDVMQLLGGDAWRDAGTLLAVLSIGMFSQATIIVSVPILTAADKGRRLLAGAVVVAVVLCSAYLAGWWCGLQYEAPTIGVAWGYALTVLVVLMVPYTWFCLTAAGYKPGEVFVALRRPACAALLMGAIVWAVSRWLEAPHLVRLVVLVAFGAIVYAALAWREVVWLLEQVKRLIGDEDTEIVSQPLP